MANRFRTAIKGTSEEILSTARVEDSDKLNGELHKMSASNSSTDLTNRFNNEESVSLNDNHQNYTSGIRRVLQNKNANDIKITENKTFAEVYDFLKDKINSSSEELRFNKLRVIFDALLEYPKNSKPVLICDLKDNIVFWVESVKMAVSSKIAQTLVFRVYPNTNNNNYANCMIFINGKEETGIRRSHSEYDPSLCVFNIIKGTGSKVQIESDFAKFVVDGYEKGEEALSNFGKFVDKFDYFTIDTEIENCSKLYTIVNDGLISNDCSDLQQAISFANKYGSSEIKNQLVEKLFESDITNVELAREVIKFILELLDSNSKEELYFKTYELFFQCTKNLLVDADEQKIAEAGSFYKESVNLIINNETFIKYALNGDNIYDIIAFISNKDKKYAKFYLYNLYMLIERGNVDWTNNDVCFDFIDKCIDVFVGDKDEVDFAEKTICKTPEQFVVFLLMYYYKLKEITTYNENDAIKLYIEQINGQYKNNNEEIRNLLYTKEGGSDVLISEFLVDLDKQENKKQFFWQYVTDVFEKIDGFKEKYFSDVLKLYLDKISKEHYYKDECYNIIGMAVKEPRILNDDMVKFVIDEYVNELPFAKPDPLTERILNSLTIIKKERNIVSNTNIEELINFGFKLENSKDINELKYLIVNNMPDLSNVNIKKKEQFIEWCFSILFKNNNSNIEELILFYNNIKELNMPSGSTYKEFLTSKENINQLISNENQLSIRQIQYYVIVVLDYLIHSHKPWNKGEEYIKFLTISVLKFENCSNEFQYILNYASNNLAYFSNLIVLYSKISDKNLKEAVQYFKLKCQLNGEEWANDISIYIGENLDYGLFSFEEFKSRFEDKNDKTTFFWKYNDVVFENSPSYKVQYFSDALEYYFEKIEKEDVYVDECFRALEIAADRVIKFKTDVMTRIITEYEKVVPLNFPSDDIEDIINEVYNLKIESNVKTAPDIIGIIQFGIKCKKENNSKRMEKLIRETSLNFEGIDKERYSEFIVWCIPMICGKINALENDPFIKKVFLLEKYKDEFLEIYNKIVNNQFNIKSFTESKAEDELPEIIDKFDENSSVISTIIVQKYNRCKNDNERKEIIKLFKDEISKKDAKEALELRKSIFINSGGENLLFDEFTVNISESTNKQVFLESYSKDIFEKIPEYMDKYFSKAVEKYLSEIKSYSSYTMDCRRLINFINNNNYKIYKELYKSIISDFEKTFINANIQDKSTIDIIQEIDRIKDKNRIVTEPDITKLLYFKIKLSSIPDEDEEKIRALIRQTSLNLNNINQQMFEGCLNEVLPKCIESVTSWQMHASIKKLLYVEKYRKVFFTKYLNVLDQEVGINEDFMFNNLAQFVIYFFNAQEKDDQELSKMIIDSIYNIMTNHPRLDIKNIENTILAESSSMKNKKDILDAWNQISEMCSSNKPEKGLFGIFRRK
ncbi:MAG: hypothetical protein Q8900_12800 [Bacillota bacterium]|nr:hypothetical protein [Bacillota bacterium]